MWTSIEKQDLVKYFKNYNSLYDEYQDYLLFENNNKIILPRYFYYNYPSSYLKISKDKEFVQKNIEIDFVGELRPEQKEAIDKLLTIYNSQNYINGFVKAFPGWGKTIFAVHMTTKIKLKTLIILDSSTLIDQWIESFKEFTNINEDDIGLFKANIDEIDKPVVITMVQTLLSKIKKNPKEIYNKIKEQGFGLVFYDEGHKTSSANKFASTSILLNTENIIGLSATPYGYNSGKVLLENTIGKIVYNSFNYQLIPKYNFILYNSKISNKEVNKIKYSRDYVKIQQKYNSIIYDNINYLSIIYQIVNKCLESGHKIIVIGSTVKQVLSINEFLNNNGIDSKPYYSKDTELDKSKNNVLVATFKKAGTGFDYKGLSALVIACPLKGKNSIVQIIGRILREEEDKKEPIVFDLIDKTMGNTFLDSVKQKTNIIQYEFQDVKIKKVVV